MRILTSVIGIGLLLALPALANDKDAAFPGNTRADPLLQRDVLKTAPFVAKHMIGKACHSEIISLDDTKLVSEPKSGNWKEIWTFSACDKKVALPIEFKSDGKGGTFYEIKGDPAKTL